MKPPGHSCPREERYNYSREDLLIRLTVLMSGRAVRGDRADRTVMICNATLSVLHHNMG